MIGKDLLDLLFRDIEWTQNRAYVSCSPRPLCVHGGYALWIYLVDTTMDEMYIDLSEYHLRRFLYGLVSSDINSAGTYNGVEYSFGII